ncbi:galactose mutarotase-like domain-containing protein [Cokeromyces recurvatus]|uniref:galactose mutarotase-like domain-containing protein n=1 Tax=Cokeromyces recurvatus TaxID=90255 RepID=UPI0022208119|nr:galactose mutarotase-like domain-containing protein [Cokeromyces recurvatus]KAI7902961.1 galactose mutarotase-like domain-containing protein [Cokeromyces recurvatus]
MISVPTYISDICLLLQEHGLTSKQLMGCKDIQTRSFDRIVGRIRPVSNWTGANLLDVASVGFSMGLLTQNATAVKIALEYFYGGVEISPRVAGDGIQADGSFMQHDGLLYNGNYGQDYMNDLLSVFTETKGTSVAPTLLTQTAFATLMSGTEWMIVSDIKLNLLLWQYSVIGRMVSFKYSDKQASGGVAINFDSVAESAEGWSKQGVIDSIVNRLESPSTGDANQGDLVGTRYFYNADYMIHRAPNYVTTMKMYSSRTVNSECLNNQNPYGFHLSDGAIYNYLTGDEYVDTFGAWNWELVPGITVDTFGTPLSCSTVKTKGKRAFVGGATDGNTGIAVMDYLNPRNGNLAFKKTAFFFPTGYAIQIGSVISKNTTAQLVTVLDQRRRNGDIYVAGKLRNTNTTYATTAGSNSIWHDNIGYYFPTTPEVLYVDSRPRASNWASIGISTGNDQQQLWTAYIKHSAKTETNQGLLTQYVVQPGINATDFNAQVAKGITPIALDFKASSPQVNAAYSAADKSIAVAFWTAGVYTPPWGSTTTIKTNQPCVLLFREIEANTLYRLTVADPSQKLEKVTLTFTVAGKVKSTTAVFPNSINAGKDVVKTITFT